MRFHLTGWDGMGQDRDLEVRWNTGTEKEFEGENNGRKMQLKWKCTSSKVSFFPTATASLLLNDFCEKLI